MNCVWLKIVKYFNYFITIDTTDYMIEGVDCEKFCLVYEEINDYLHSFYMYELRGELVHKDDRYGFLKQHECYSVKPLKNVYYNYFYMNCGIHIIYFFNKIKCFNKNKISRFKQTYKTGVYWCLWLNVIITVGLNFLFYKFTFNVGYIWFGIYIVCSLLFFSKLIQYKNVISFKDYYNLLIFTIKELFHIS